MSAWSTGPFGSDSALDYLSNLGATADVVADLTATLTAVTRPAGDPAQEYRHRTVDHAYAAAGLVAAVLADQDVPTDAPAEVLAALDGIQRVELGLRTHYQHLLRPSDAESLRQPALTAVTAIGGEREWLEAWMGDDILAQLTRLEAVLTHAPASPQPGDDNSGHSDPDKAAAPDASGPRSLSIEVEEVDGTAGAYVLWIDGEQVADRVAEAHLKVAVAEAVATYLG